MEFTREEYKRGIEFCVKNSDDFIYEAKILWLMKRPHAYALYQLSIEEIGKAMHLLILNFQDEFRFDNITEFNKIFSNHGSKNDFSQLTDLVGLLILKAQKNQQKLECVFLNFLNEDINEWTNKLNPNKNSSLYVSIDNERFKQPSGIVTEKMVEEISSKARLRNLIFKKIMELGILTSENNRTGEDVAIYSNELEVMINKLYKNKKPAWLKFTALQV